MPEIDETVSNWQEMVDAALVIRRRIIASGGMATKTRVEDELMPMFGIDRRLAHDVTNYLESCNLR